MAAEENKLNELVGRMIGEIGAAYGAALVIVA
jgi:hypothetical protein